MCKRIRILFICLALSCISSLLMGQNALWITSSDCRNKENTWIAFRKSVKIKQPPKSLPTRIAVDSKYWLWINNKLVVYEGGLKRGPSPRNTYCDSIDIAPYLKKGENTIAVLLWYFGKDGFSHKNSGKAALFFNAVNNDICIISDTTWVSRTHPAYENTSYPKPNFRLPEANLKYNATKDIGTWYNTSYDAVSNGFLASISLGKENTQPWSTLVPRPIPFWKDYGVRDYVKTEIKTGVKQDTLIAYLPYNCQIHPILEVDAEAGQSISIITDNTVAGGDINLRAEYITKKGKQRYEDIAWLNGHKVYYIFPKEVKIQKVQYRETGYNTEFLGSFHCNDSFLNTLWEKSRRSVYVNMRDTYMDCPDRERAQWWGDEVNELITAFYAFCPQSYALCKKGMYELVNWQRKDKVLYSPIPGNWNQELPGQILAGVGYYGFWTYYQYTGDKQTIADVYEKVKQYLNVWQIDYNGLIKYRSGDWAWGDWGENKDVKLLDNAWYYLALQGVYNMACVLNQTADIERYGAMLVDYKQAFNQEFWTGKYYQSFSYNGRPDERAQALAILSGLAEPEKYQALLQIFKTEENASPFMERFVLEALFYMGETEYALNRMHKRFAYMVNHPDYSTLFEGWGIGKNGYGGGSVNHGYSAGCLPLLSRYVCGISPLAQGYDTILIAPQPGNLATATATVPSVKGLIKTSFQKTQTMFTLECMVPTYTVVALPAGKSVRKVKVNGKIVFQDGNFIKQDRIALYSDPNSEFPQFLVPEGRWKWEVE